MPNNRVLSNTNYAIADRSSFAVDVEETRDIIDLPHFPANNLVDVSGKLNLFTSDDIELYFPYTEITSNVKNRKLLGLINRKDARILFVEYDEDERQFIYKFTGLYFPQGREDFAYTYNGINTFTLFGGMANGSGLQDLWQYNATNQEWTLLNYREIELSANQIPSRRRKSNLIELDNEILIFGGETDTLVGSGVDGNVFIPLNDVWSFNKNIGRWTNYDINRILPRRTGNIVHVSNTEIKILVISGTNEIGQEQNTGIWTVNRNTNEVDFDVYTPPFTVLQSNVSLYLDDRFFIQSGNELYEWNNDTNSFNTDVVYNDISAVHVEEDTTSDTIELWRWKVNQEIVNRGDDSRMDTIDIVVPVLYDSSDTINKTLSVTTPPQFSLAQQITFKHLQNSDVVSFTSGIFWYAGLIDNTTFNERVFLYDRITNNTHSIAIREELRPTERVGVSITYDERTNRVWLFGGYDGTRFYNDLWYFNIDSFLTKDIFSLPVWSSETDYGTNEIICYEGSSYSPIRPISISTWLQSQTYVQHNIVIYNDKYYKASADISPTSVTPDIDDNWNEISFEDVTPLNDSDNWNVNDIYWTKVSDNVMNTDDELPTSPQPRQLAGISITDDGNVLNLLGGYSDVRSFNDFWAYNINNSRWNREYTIDTIPFGSSYTLFGWKGRTWMFNGDISGIYRYYFSRKQFTKQGVNNNYASDRVRDIVRRREYLGVPITINIIGDRLHIYSSDIGNVSINMTDKSLFDYSRDFSLDNPVNWIDDITGYDNNTLATYFIDISPLTALTKNQIPSSYYSYDADTLKTVGFYSSEVGTNILNTRTNTYSYYDTSGAFELQEDNIYKDKATALIDGDVSFAGIPLEYPTEDLTDPDRLSSLSIENVTAPQTQLIEPRYIYNDFYVLQEQLSGAVDVFTRNGDNNRIYIIYNNGNMVRLNLTDFTFFTYFTNIWKSGAVGYNPSSDISYAFGGVFPDNQKPNDPFPYDHDESRQVYDQSGLRTRFISYENVKLATHDGFMRVDLSLNTFTTDNFNSYLTQNNISVIDYDVTRQYLIDLVKSFIESGNRGTLNPVAEETIRDRLYEATQPIMDDLSQLDTTFEDGERPYRRALHTSCVIDNKMYIFGGADVYLRMVNGEWTILRFPHYVTKIGQIFNNKLNIENPGSEGIADALLDTSDLSSSAYYLDMDVQAWVRISNMPFWLYNSSAIPSPDNKKIYIVGGARNDNCGELYNGILIYDIETNTYQEVLGITDNYRGRMNPVLFWLDEDRLLIKYGIKSEIITGDFGSQSWSHLPVNDAWIYDRKNDIIYKALEDFALYGLAVKDTYLKNPSEDNFVYILNPYPVPEDLNRDATDDNLSGIDIHLYKTNIISGDTETIRISPSVEIYNDFSINFQENRFQPQTGNASSGSSYIDSYVSFVSSQTNFRFRYAWLEEYGDLSHKHIFIIGERAEQSGIEFISKIAEGFEETHLRIWYVNLDVPTRTMIQVAIEYPLPISPISVSYDGSTYLYVVWNQFNIWRLNLKQAILDPTSDYWFRLPPCVNCTFLQRDNDGSGNTGVLTGDVASLPSLPSNIFDSFYDPDLGYMYMISSEGFIAKLDVNSFTWFIDNEVPPVRPFESKTPTVSRTDIDVSSDEVYRFFIGGIGGQFYNLFYKQWDNFFFDLRKTNRIVNLFKSILENNLYPSFVKRKRLYVWNHLGHIYYNWIRIDGMYDVEYQLLDFYDVKDARIYTDLEGLNQYDNWELEVFRLNGGWTNITTAISDSDHPEWDSQSSYVIDSTVVFNETLYKAVNDISEPASESSNIPPNEDTVNWDVMSAMGFIVGKSLYETGSTWEWDDGTFRRYRRETPIIYTTWNAINSYANNEEVIYNGFIYRATSAITGSSSNTAPDVDTGRWDSVGLPPAIQFEYTNLPEAYIAIPDISLIGVDEWNGLDAYTANNILRYNDRLYRTKVDISEGTEPSPNDTPDTAGSSEWTETNNPISKARLKFTPEKRNRNYIARLNRFELLDTDSEFNILQSGSNIEQVHLEPIRVTSYYPTWNSESAYSASTNVRYFNDVYTSKVDISEGSTDSPNMAPNVDLDRWQEVDIDVFSVPFNLTIENTSDSAVSDVVVYLVDNVWVQFSVDDGTTWVIATEDNPLQIADTIASMGRVDITVRGINIDNNPRIGDIVIRGVYAL